jgi:hypothetical protein
MLSASASQTATLLRVSTDTITNLIHQRRLRRLPGNRWIKIELVSLSEYTGLPLELVIKELRRIETNGARPKASESDSKNGNPETRDDGDQDNPPHGYNFPVA